MPVGGRGGRQRVLPHERTTGERPWRAPCGRAPRDSARVRKPPGHRRTRDRILRDVACRPVVTPPTGGASLRDTLAAPKRAFGETASVLYMDRLLCSPAGLLLPQEPSRSDRMEPRGMRDMMKLAALWATVSSYWREDCRLTEITESVSAQRPSCPMSRRMRACGLGLWSSGMRLSKPLRWSLGAAGDVSGGAGLRDSTSFISTFRAPMEGTASCHSEPVRSRSKRPSMRCTVSRLASTPLKEVSGKRMVSTEEHHAVTSFDVHCATARSSSHI